MPGLIPYVELVYKEVTNYETNGLLRTEAICCFCKWKIIHNNDHGIYVFALFDEYSYELMYIVGKLLEIVSKWNVRYWGMFVDIVVSSEFISSCFFLSKIISTK